ncbi:unnamed protein product [Moneuplotes crassus]|uniref:Uncharacterized protein n=1 Tax=Euplotes crassus TaxID=5936 RepID=A0AAD1XC49_EUPCR|nr:unnamed protein product [Moneuplotes crassus]
MEPDQRLFIRQMKHSPATKPVSFIPLGAQSYSKSPRVSSKIHIFNFPPIVAPKHTPKPLNFRRPKFSYNGRKVFSERKQKKKIGWLSGNMNKKQHSTAKKVLKPYSNLVNKMKRGSHKTREDKRLAIQGTILTTL